MTWWTDLHFCRNSPQTTHNRWLSGQLATSSSVTHRCLCRARSTTRSLSLFLMLANYVYFTRKGLKIMFKMVCSYEILPKHSSRDILKTTLVQNSSAVSTISQVYLMLQWPPQISQIYTAHKGFKYKEQSHVLKEHEEKNMIEGHSTSVFHRYWLLQKFSYWQNFPVRLVSGLIWLAKIDLTPDGLLYFTCQMLHDVN